LRWNGGEAPAEAGSSDIANLTHCTWQFTKPFWVGVFLLFHLRTETDSDSESVVFCLVYWVIKRIQKVSNCEVYIFMFPVILFPASFWSYCLSDISIHM
jgi:hypothetical protein